MAERTDLQSSRCLTPNHQQLQGLRNVASGAAYEAGGRVYALMLSTVWPNCVICVW